MSLDMEQVKYDIWSQLGGHIVKYDINNLETGNKPGIYFIVKKGIVLGKSNYNEIQYIGKTQRSIRQRVNQNNSTRDTGATARIALVEQKGLDNDTVDFFEEVDVYYLEYSQKKKRDHDEKFLIKMLQPPLNTANKTL